MTAQANMMNILRVLYDAREKGPLHKKLSPEALAECVGQPWARIELEVSDLEESGYLRRKCRHIGSSLITTVHITTEGAAIVKEYMDTKSDGKNQVDEYNIAAIRNLLRHAFTPEELGRFCNDRPSFRQILNSFGPKFSFEDMIEEVIKYCQRRVLLSELLSEIREFNIRQYDRWSPYTESTSLDGEA